MDTCGFINGQQAPGYGKGLGSLACCSSWGRKESDMTEQLNNSNMGLSTNIDKVLAYQQDLH